jgi:hypothetical protein
MGNNKAQRQRQQVQPGPETLEDVFQHDDLRGFLGNLAERPGLRGVVVVTIESGNQSEILCFGLNRLEEIGLLNLALDQVR